MKKENVKTLKYIEKPNISSRIENNGKNGIRVISGQHREAVVGPGHHGVIEPAAQRGGGGELTPDA